MASAQIRELFAGDIYRRIEEVIKVDQTDEAILREELAEYVLTDAIRNHYKNILRSYWERRHRSPTRGSQSGSPVSSARANRASLRCSASRFRTDRSLAPRLPIFSPVGLVTPSCRCCSSRSPSTSRRTQ